MREPDDIKIADAYSMCRKYIVSHLDIETLIAWDNCFFRHYDEIGKNQYDAALKTNKEMGLDIPMVANDKGYI